MKRFIAYAAAFCLMLCGCDKTPSLAADGSPWSEEWTTLGNLLGVEEPGSGLILRDNNEALSVNDMYLATWTAGEPTPYLNEDGDEVELYPARLDVLVYGRKDEDTAAKTLDDWADRQSQTYAVKDTRRRSFGGQEYLISAYDCKSETNPYSRGVSAFAVYGKYAVSVELNCQKDFSGDESAILTDFLDGCHYAAE